MLLAYLHNNNSFLDHIAYPCPYEFKKDIDASFSCRLNFNRRLSDRLDALPYKVDIDFRGISEWQTESAHTQAEI